MMDKDSTGLVRVAQRRLDALQQAIAQRSDWNTIEWHYDNAKSAIDRALNIDRSRITDCRRGR
jgi:hypothetical protein